LIFGTSLANHEKSLISFQVFLAIVINHFSQLSNSHFCISDLVGLNILPAISACLACSEALFHLVFIALNLLHALNNHNVAPCHTKASKSALLSSGKLSL